MFLILRPRTAWLYVEYVNVYLFCVNKKSGKHRKVEVIFSGFTACDYDVYSLASITWDDREMGARLWVIILSRRSCKPMPDFENSEQRGKIRVRDNRKHEGVRAVVRTRKFARISIVMITKVTGNSLEFHAFALLV